MLDANNGSDKAAANSGEIDRQQGKFAPILNGESAGLVTAIQKSLQPALDQARIWMEQNGLNGITIAPEKPIEKAKVAELIGNLNSNNYAVREAATNILQEMGHGVKKQVDEALNDPATPLEARRRLSEISISLETPSEKRERIGKESAHTASRNLDAECQAEQQEITQKLEAARKKGNANEVEYLEKELKAVERDRKVGQALISAIRSGDVDAIAKLVKENDPKDIYASQRIKKALAEMGIQLGCFPNGEALNSDTLTINAAGRWKPSLSFIAGGDSPTLSTLDPAPTIRPLLREEESPYLLSIRDAGVEALIPE